MTKEAQIQNPTPSPRFFRDILGQERVLGYLKAALAAGAVGPRLSVSGAGRGGERIRGPGFGRGPELRRALGRRGRLRGVPVVQTPGRGDASGFSRHQSHIGTSTQIVIDQIREFRRVTAYPPVGGGWRLALIKPAEALRRRRGQCPPENPGRAAPPESPHPHRRGGGGPLPHRGLPLPEAGLHPPALPPDPG
jgi:hypothetical protein